jgi:hypothetical protein
MKKPTAEDFGLTEQEYSSLLAERFQINDALSKLPVHGLSGPIGALFYISMIVGGIGGAIFYFILSIVFGFYNFGTQTTDYIQMCCFFGGSICFFIFALKHIFKENKEDNQKRTQYRKQLSNPKFHNVAKYEEAISRFEKTQLSYWKSLRGTEFEKALANLYKKMGYSVQQTKASGDEGIDLIISKEDKTTIVQCKGHVKPIGIGAARDLFGTMMHCKADSAILACPAGFTKAVVKFVNNKPIQLLSAGDLIEMSEEIYRQT